MIASSEPGFAYDPEVIKERLKYRDDWMMLYLEVMFLETGSYKSGAKAQDAFNTVHPNWRVFSKNQLAEDFS